MKINNCKHCGSDKVDFEFRDSISCIAYVQCYKCREIGPFSKSYREQELAIEEAIELWNSDELPVTPKLEK